MAAAALALLDCREAPRVVGPQAKQEPSTGVQAEGRPPGIAIRTTDQPAATSNDTDRPIYRVGGAVSRPELIHRVDPDYARLDRRTVRVTGLPILEAVISDTGTVESVRMLKPMDPELDAVLLEAVRQWRFRPAMKDGRPVRVRYTLTVHIHWR